MESTRECGLLSLVYVLVALNSQVVAVVAKHIRKMWKYIRGGENEVCLWSSSLGRRNSVTNTPWSSVKSSCADRAWLWPSETAALCFPKLWDTDLHQWTLQLSPLAQGSAFYPCVRVLVFCVLIESGWICLREGRLNIFGPACLPLVKRNCPVFLP